MTILCPNCKAIIQVQNPELEVAHVALACLGGVIARDPRDLRSFNDPATLAETAFHFADAFLAFARARLKASVQHE